MSYKEAHKVLTALSAKADRLVKLAKSRAIRETEGTARTRAKIILAHSKVMGEINRVVKSLDPHPDPSDPGLLLDQAVSPLQQ